MLTTSPLTGFGISNLELLLLLIGLGTLAGAGYWLLRRRWHDEMRRKESALVETQQQHDQLQRELAVTQQQGERLQSELAEVQRQRDQLQGELTVAQQQGERLQSELAEAQHQRELDETQHQSEMGRVRALHDPVRIKELLDHSERVLAHKFGSPLFDIAERCREAVPRVHSDQPDLLILLNIVNAKARELLQRTKVIVGSGNLEGREIHWETLRTCRVLESVVNEQLAYAEPRGVRLLTDYGSLGPILTDKLLLHDLYTVVIQNAIKFSQENAGMVVEIAQRLEDESGQRMFIDVRDHGRGIVAEDHERIFEENVRGDGWVVPGSGLGLNYGRRIARRLGGDLILVESTLGKGSLFRIILPYGERIDSSQPDEPNDSTSASDQSESLVSDEQRDSPQPGEQDDSPRPDTTSEGETQ